MIIAVVAARSITSNELKLRGLDIRMREDQRVHCGAAHCP